MISNFSNISLFPLYLFSFLHINSCSRRLMGYIISSVVLTAALFPLQGATAAEIDDAKAESLGIRKITGRHLTLYTDLAGDEIDRLPEVFDRAFPQWLRYFNVPEKNVADWHITGALMKDKKPFVLAGLLPDDVPDFLHGYSRGDRLWLYEQPSDYYRRHLFLHEGTHAFMNTVLGGCGPPWYMEAVAEYLATHRWNQGELTLGYMPKNRQEVPEWGRIRLIQDAVAAGRALTFPRVLEIPSNRQAENEFYAWCWAAATLLDRDPRYRDRFRQMIQHVQNPDFDKQFRSRFESDWLELCEQWQLMIADLEYGYDVERSAVDFQNSSLPQTGEGQGMREFAIAADRGWQNTGLQLEAGKRYRLTASGRFQVADPGQIWWSEPNGVSVRYYRGRPLGVLLAAVRPNEPTPDGTSALLHPSVVGLATTLTPKTTGTLFLKINDSAGELDDNAGEVSVRVQSD